MTRVAIFSLFLFLSILKTTAAPTEVASTPKETSGPVYVLPIRDEIEETMVFRVRRGVKEAMKMKASALILHMNTPGGEGEAMRKIMEAVSKFEPASETYTLVDTDAFSAGAFIAASTKHIYMTPGSKIGAASPVTMGQGGVQELPQKFVSAYAAMIRAAAEQNGHNPLVFDAMVNKDKGLTIDGKDLAPKGSVITLTTTEASQLVGKPPKPLLAQPIENLAALEKKIGGATVSAVEFKPTGYEQVARMITMVSPLLLTAAFILGYLEFKMSGTILFGVASAICFLLVFFGHYIAGLSGQEAAVFFVLGVLCLLTEIFFLPGTLVPAFVGVLFIIGSLLYSMTDIYPTDPTLPSLAQLEIPIYNLGIAVALAITGSVILFFTLPHKVLIGNLSDATVSGPASDAYTRLKVGECGVALTSLRPAGSARFADRSIDVVSEGSFIEKNTPIVVTRVEGMRVVVKPVA